MSYYGYVRVSSFSQGQKGISLEVQENFLRKRAEALNIDFILQREVESGKNLEGRPVLTQLIKTLKKDDILGVYDESRLSRNTSDSIKISTALANKGAILEIAGKVIDVEDPTDELTFTINSAIAAYQRKLQNKKAQASIDIKRQNGEMVISGDLLGYKLYKKKGKTYAEIDEDEAKVIRFIYESYKRGKNPVIISRNTDINLTRIRTILVNPIYIGKYLKDANIDRLQHPELITDENLIESKIYPAIISDDLFYDVLTLYKKVHKKGFANRHSIHEVTGIWHTPCCNAGYVFTKNGKLNYYNVTQHRTGCSNPIRFGIRATELENITRCLMFLTLCSGIEVSSFYADQRNLLYGNVQEIKDKIIEKEKLIKDTTNKINNLLDMALENQLDRSLIKNKMDVFKKTIDDAKLEVAELRVSADAIEGSIEEVIETENENSIDAFLQSSDEEKRNFYLRHIKTAIIFEDTFEIVFNNMKRFTINRKNYEFEMSFRDIKQATGVIDSKTGKIRFCITSNNAFEEWANINYCKLEEEVNSLMEI